MMSKLAVLSLVILAIAVGATTTEYNPVVIMHGIGASASSMNSVVSWIGQAFPGIYVKNVEIGNGCGILRKTITSLMTMQKS